MLVAIKNRQSKIASATLTVFIGSWLLLLCQTCFASNNSIDSHGEALTEVTSPCHAPDIEKASTVHDEHCLGVCDCHSMTMVFSSDKNSELKEKIKFTPDLYAYVAPEIIISTRPPPTYRVSITPERTIPLPRYTYNVLLI